MSKFDYLKYIAFGLILLILILPQENKAWMVILGLAGGLIVFWLFKNYGGANVWKYLGILLVLPLLLVDTSSKFFVWNLAIAIAVGIIWALRKWVFKGE